MNELIISNLGWFWSFLLSPTISLFTLSVGALVGFLGWKYGLKLYNKIVGEYYYHLLQTDDWEKANKLLIKRGKYHIIQPSFLGVKGMDDNYSGALLEFSTGYSCKYNDAGYDGSFNPIAFGIALTDEQAYTIKVAMEDFLHLNKEGAKPVKPSHDGRVIDIKNMFPRKD